ncbi:MAG TPA: hypothetical protein VIW22_06910 [Nitrososphaerales archaeon]
MTQRKNVGDYLAELEKTKNDREEQVKEGLEIYIDLWKKTIENGVVRETDLVEEALEKIEEKGGLYKAAES